MCALMHEEDGGIGFSVLSSSFWVAWIDPPDGQLELAAGSNGCRPSEGDGAPKLVLQRCTQICVPANQRKNLHTQTSGGMRSLSSEIYILESDFQKYKERPPYSDFWRIGSFILRFPRV
ncbi:hypothetical protein ACLOJK_034595 [Asimina triloba]